MIHTDTLEITPVEFFDAIGTSLLMDIKNSTGKECQIKDLQRGFHYHKEIKTANKKMVNAKVLITEFKSPTIYRAEFVSGDDITKISYCVEAIGNDACRINYQESFETSKKVNQVSYKIMSFFMKRNAKKKIVRLLNEIEAYGIAKRKLSEEGEK